MDVICRALTWYLQRDSATDERHPGTVTERAAHHERVDSHEDDDRRRSRRPTYVSPRAVIDRRNFFGDDSRHLSPPEIIAFM